MRDNDGLLSNEASSVLNVGPNEQEKPEAEILYVSPPESVRGEWIAFAARAIDRGDGWIRIREWRLENTWLSDELSFVKNDIPIGQHQVTFGVQDNDCNWSDYRYITIKVTHGIQMTWLINMLTGLAGASAGAVAAWVALHNRRSKSH